VYGDLIGLDPLLVDALLEELRGELARFAMAQHPAHHLPAEDVEQYVALIFSSGVSQVTLARGEVRECYLANVHHDGKTNL